MAGVEPEPTDADLPQQVQQEWAGLLAAATQAGYAVDELVRPPAGPAEVAEAEQAIGRPLPADLALLYQLSDGQADWYDLVHGPAGNTSRPRGRWAGSLFGAGWSFNSLEALRTEYQIWADLRRQNSADDLTDGFNSVTEVRAGDPVKPLYTCPDWIPFATDGGGNSLAADLTPEPDGHSGQVIVIGPDEDRRRVIAPSVRALLRLCAGLLREQAATLEPEDDEGVALYLLEP
jgi:cell wall assembly regulator SMI1